MTAIVTDVHYRASLALVRDLAEAGVRVVCCERTGVPGVLGFCSRWAARRVTLPDPGWLEALYRLCGEITQEEGERPALLPVGAITLGELARDARRFSQVCGLCISTPQQLDDFNSKGWVHKIAQEVGAPVPAAFVISPGEKEEAFAARLPLPCVVKPLCGERLGLPAPQRYTVARTREQALESYRHFSALAGEPPQVLEFLPGAGLGCSVLCEEGRVVAAICHRRVREYPVAGGPSSCCACIHRPDLVAWVEKIVEKSGYTGIAMFEFKEDAAGAPRLLEVNPRIWGTFPLTRAAGSVIPRLWCALAWNAGNPDRQAPLPQPGPLPETKMIFAASDLMAALGYARRGRPGEALRALGDFFNPSVRDGLFEWKDIMPGLLYYRSLLAKERHP